MLAEQLKGLYRLADSGKEDKIYGQGYMPLNLPIGAKNIFQEDGCFPFFNILVYAEGNHTHFTRPFGFFQVNELLQGLHRSGTELAPGCPEGQENDLAILVCNLKRAWFICFGEVGELSEGLTNICLTKNVVFYARYFRKSVCNANTGLSSIIEFFIGEHCIDLGLQDSTFSSCLQVHGVAIRHLWVAQLCRETELVVDLPESLEYLAFLFSCQILPSKRLLCPASRLSSSTSGNHSSTPASGSRLCSSSATTSTRSGHTLSIHLSCCLKGLLFGHLALGSLSALFPNHSSHFQDFRWWPWSLLSRLQLWRGFYHSIFLTYSELNFASPAGQLSLRHYV